MNKMILRGRLVLAVIINRNFIDISKSVIIAYIKSYLQKNSLYFIAFLYGFMGFGIICQIL